MIKTFILTHKVDGKTPTVNNRIYDVVSFQQAMTKAMERGLWLVDSVRESYKKTGEINIADCIGKVIKYDSDNNGTITFEIDCNDATYVKDITDKVTTVGIFSRIIPTDYWSDTKPNVVLMDTVLCLYLDCLTVKV